jgi:hypothetical protein
MDDIDANSFYSFFLTIIKIIAGVDIDVDALIRLVKSIVAITCKFTV